MGVKFRTRAVMADDTVYLRLDAALNKGNVTIHAGNGDNYLFLGNNAAGSTGTLSYVGGSGEDEISTGRDLAVPMVRCTFDLGSDTSNDVDHL